MANNSNRFESEHLSGREVLARCNAGDVAIGYVSQAAGVYYAATACPIGLRLVVLGRLDAIGIPSDDCDGRTFEAIVCQIALAGRRAS